MDGKSSSLELTSGELVRKWPGPPQHQRRGVGKGVGRERVKGIPNVWIMYVLFEVQRNSIRK